MKRSQQTGNGKYRPPTCTDETEAKIGPIIQLTKRRESSPYGKALRRRANASRKVPRCHKGMDALTHCRPSDRLTKFTDRSDKG